MFFASFFFFFFFFLPSVRSLVFVGEKVNSLEKLANVGRIVDRGSCFGRVFCTDATIATVRPARTGGHIWARSYGVVWAWLTRITRSHPSLSVSSLTHSRPSYRRTRGSRFEFLSSKLWFCIKCWNDSPIYDLLSWYLFSNFDFIFLLIFDLIIKSMLLSNNIF